MLVKLSGFVPYCNCIVRLSLFPLSLISTLSLADDSVMSAAARVSIEGKVMTGISSKYSETLTVTSLKLLNSVPYAVRVPMR